MDLYKLLAFNQLVIDRPEDEKKSLALSLNIDYEEYKMRIVGKEKEADFIIILKSLDALIISKLMTKDYLILQENILRILK